MLSFTPCKMQASNPPWCMGVLAHSQGADGCRLRQLGQAVCEGESWVDGFCMLTFVFVLTGIGFVAVCIITCIFMANVLLTMLLLCTEHMPPH